MLTGRPELLKQASALLPPATRFDTRNHAGLTALMIATIHNDEPVLKALLDAGANPNIEVQSLGSASSSTYAIHSETQHWTALTFAACRGHYAAVRLLLQRGTFIQIFHAPFLALGDRSSRKLSWFYWNFRRVCRGRSFSGRRPVHADPATGVVCLKCNGHGRTASVLRGQCVPVDATHRFDVLCTAWELQRDLRRSRTQSTGDASQIDFASAFEGQSRCAFAGRNASRRRHLLHT